MDDVKVIVTPKYPLFWQALYPSHLKEIKIPICKKCEKLIKISSYDRIICNNNTSVDSKIVPCSSEDVSFDPNDGAKIIPLQEGVLCEFDAEGNDTISFKYLPTDGLQAFGLIDPMLDPSPFYMINLRNGNLEIGTSMTGVAIPLGVGIEFPTQDGKNIIPVSNVLKEYGRGGDLIHYKHAISTIGVSGSVAGEDRQIDIGRFKMDERVLDISNIVVGYKCRIPNANGEIEWDVQVKVNVDCHSHIPYITTKATRQT